MQNHRRWQIVDQRLYTDYQPWCQAICRLRQPPLASHEAIDLSEFTPEAVGIESNHLQAAAARLKKARDRGEKVLIFGDYDVDGNCAVAILWQALMTGGLRTTPFIPHRFRHGYGMSTKALAEIFESSKPDLIVTVDNGITAASAIAYAKEHGVEVIVTDHHRLDPTIDLGGITVVQTTCLCGAGVAWMLGREFLRLTSSPHLDDTCRQLLDLVAIATIVDQVPLIGVNRRLVQAGWRQLRVTTRPGLISLAAQAKLDLSQITSRDIGFGLGPRLNAIGRLTNTLDTLRLLCTSKKTYADKLATTLDGVNNQRQELTADMVAVATAQIDESHLDKIILVASQDFHEGVIGLIASHLVDKYGRPAIVVQVSDTLAKASARSVPGVNITDFLRQLQADLIDVGGHALAAGCSFLPSKLSLIRQKVRRLSEETITAEMLVSSQNIDTRVTPAVLCSPELPELLEQLEPYGAGQPKITVSVEGQVVQVKLLGSEQQHLKITLLDRQNCSADCLIWGYQQRSLGRPQIGSSIAVIGQPRINHWQNRQTIDIIGEDWQALKK